jgi:methylmalonyl-CoA mutase C-terminal domain/subunit
LFSDATQKKPVDSSSPVRVLLAKPGMDGHNRGIRVVARTLRDAGFEVIYLGIRRRPEHIAAAAIAEDVDVVGLSLLSGAHLTLCERTRNALDALGATDIRLVCGGIIPTEDHDALRAVGVSGIFTPGSRAEVIVTSLNQLAAGRRHDADPSSAPNIADIDSGEPVRSSSQPLEHHNERP